GPAAATGYGVIADQMPRGRKHPADDQFSGWGLGRPRIRGMHIEKDGALEAHRAQNIRQGIHNRSADDRACGADERSFASVPVTPTLPSLGVEVILTGSRYMSAMSGNCFCGEVKFEVTGSPAAMGYCHCESCRQWSAGPVNAFTLWDPKSLKITHGAA